MGVELSVVVPTYHEVANMRALVTRLFAALDRAGVRGEVIIVDDDSGDGTEELCQTLAREYERLRLLVRKHARGLATATFHGMAQATGEVLVCMDADLSHRPEDVPALFRAVRDGEADIAIGSRYVAGGQIDERWGAFRRLNSRVARWLARGLADLHDPMSGFFAVRRDLIRRAQGLAPVGYKTLLELLVRCPAARRKEIPIVFNRRRHGRSKLSLAEQLGFLRHLARLYGHRFGRRGPASPDPR